MVWFASFFNNETLISISIVQLLHSSHLDLVCTSPGSGSPARTVCREKSRQPKKPIPAPPSQALPKLGRSGSDGNTVRAPGGCADSMLQVAPAYAKKVLSLVGRKLPCAGSTHHWNLQPGLQAHISTHGAFAAHTWESTAQTSELKPLRGPAGGLRAGLRGQVTLWQCPWVYSIFQLGNGMGLRWHLGQDPSTQNPCRFLQNPAHCVSPVN